MFVIKVIIAFIVIFAIFMNGFSILFMSLEPINTRYFNFLIYLIILLILFQIGMSYKLHRTLVYKKGFPGEAGIRGQKGDIGNSGTCAADCGKKVCYAVIEQDAHNALTYNIKKMKGQNPEIEQSIIECARTTHTERDSKGNTIEIPKIDLDVCKKVRETSNNNNNNKNTKSVSEDKIKCVSIQDVSDNVFGGDAEIRYRIKNKLFLNKLRLICSSKQYLAILEKEHKNKPTEKKLIEYISSIIIKWIEKIVNFYIETEDDSGKKKTIYLGIIFLMSPDSPLNLIETLEMNNPETGTSNSIQSPLREMEKYDIWGWGDPLTDSPLIVKKCLKNITPPLAIQQKLKTVYTNNYKTIFSVEESFPKDVWDTTNCPYGQMGKDDTNPDNLKVCINRSAYKSVLEEKGTIRRSVAWKTEEYRRKSNITFLHPKYTIDGNGERIYYKDKNNKNYYPVGSVWTSNSPNKDDKYSKKTILVTGDVTPPKDYELIWDNKDTEGNSTLSGNNYKEVSLWRPIPKPGYIALGDVAVNKWDKKPSTNISDTPVVCVNKSCVAELPLGSEIWNTEDVARINYKTEENYRMYNNLKLGVIDTDVTKYDKDDNLRYPKLSL